MCFWKRRARAAGYDCPEFEGEDDWYGTITTGFYPGPDYEDDVVQTGFVCDEDGEVLGGVKW